ncbi:MAG: cyclopropane-fatty-acyl-phospholipid synthase [Nitrobacter sp.]|uniref:class I SAM-dependent methyltransferase n=1 Tax=Nitrobacter sp. TaxID=29420 RepID=UPI00387DD9EF
MLDAYLRQSVRNGSLGIIWPNGRQARYGEEHRPQVVVRLNGPLTPLKLALHPYLYLGEAYMDGSLRLERGTLWDLMDLLCKNLAGQRDGWLLRLARPMISSLTQHNSRRLARRHVAHHYDLSNKLYRLFLDKDLQYSCAYFKRPDLTLDAAQAAKKRHLIAKLQLQAGQRVLDIGCGWGGLALSVAEAANVEVLGITLSREQLEVARQRASEAGLSGRVKFKLMDFRDVKKDAFDRIVSVGMFEHVGAPNYAAFFEQIRKLLSPSGIAVLHAIGRMHGPSITSRWMQKYIFPGGYIPALSQVIPHVERCGLWLTDLEILRLHYAKTLRLWRERIQQSREAVEKLYDKRFCRMWEYYLVASEMSFRYAGFMVFQIQLAKAVGAVPLTRDYLFETERDVTPFFGFPTIDASAAVGVVAGFGG